MTHDPSLRSGRKPASGDTVPPSPHERQTVDPTQPPKPDPRDDAFGPLPATFGHYQIRKLLGKGGMGSVYLAHDRRLDRLVALKVPSFTRTDGPEPRKRFLREARAAATLQHPNICPVYEVDELDGKLYFTMAFIEGKSLAEVLRASRKPLAEREVAALVRKLALALDEAHRKGVIHRDLKPGNVMLNQRAEPIIMDFGLARRGKKDHLTQHGEIMGTPAYMAPEQALGNPDEMGPSCDVYSLGVILYELLTRKLPFTGAMLDVLTRVVSEPPKPPSRHRPELDGRLEEICLKTLAKKPAERYATMRDLADALTAYLKASSPQGSDGAGPLPVTETEPLVRPRSRPARSGSSAWAWGVFVVALVALLGVAAALLLPPGRERGENVGQATALVAKAPTLVDPEEDWEEDPVPDEKPKEVPTPAPAKKDLPGKDNKANLPPIKAPPNVAIGGGAPVAKMPPKGDNSTGWTWPPGVLSAGRARAPSVAQGNLYFEDYFTLKNKRFPEPKTQNKAYLPTGGYRIRVPGKADMRSKLLAAVPLERKFPKAAWYCDLAGRVATLDTRWGISVQQRNSSASFRVSLDGHGAVYVGTGTGRAQRHEHPAILKGVGVDNGLLVIVHSRHLEVYVNGAAVCDPAKLNEDFTDPEFSLFCGAAPAQSGLALFKGIRIGGAAFLAPLPKRMDGQTVK